VLGTNFNNDRVILLTVLNIAVYDRHVISLFIKRIYLSNVIREKDSRKYHTSISNSYK